MTKHYCDICKKEIIVGTFDCIMVKVDNLVIAGKTTQESYMTCRDCYDGSDLPENIRKANKNKRLTIKQ